MSLLICHFRFSIFVLETLKFEWQCSQYLELNPTSVQANALLMTMDFRNPLTY